MAATVFDSPMFAKSYPTGEAARLFSDSAAVRAVLLVLGNLAKVQGEQGIVAEDSAFFIHRSAMEVQIDPAGLDLLADGMVPAITAVFQKAMEAPEHSAFIQHGANGDQIEQAALALRLRQFLAYCGKRLQDVDGLSNDTALDKQIAQAKATSIGLFLTAEAGTAEALGEALRLPVLSSPADMTPVASVANAIAQSVAVAQPGNERIAQLARLADSLAQVLDNDPQKMANICLPQLCLSAAAALEIAAS